jgi:hypothetical protein
VLAGGRLRGTGFFVQNGLVLTCAHVVKRLDDLHIAYDGRSLPVDVVLRVPEEHGPGQLYAFPDLAFLRLREPLDHPWLSLARTPQLPDRLAAITHGGVEPTEFPIRFDVVGRRGQYLRVRGDQILDGMSGAPAYDPATGWVHGIIKASDDKRSVAGGLVVEATHIGYAMDSHAELLPARSTPRRPLSLPAGTPIHHLVTAQYQASDRLAYRIVDDPSLTQSKIYVRQQMTGTARRTPAEFQTAEAAVGQHRHLVLTGTAGAGKTSLLSHISRRSAQWWLDPAPDTDPPFGPVVALRIPARILASGRPLHEALAATISAECGPLLDIEISPTLFARPPVPGAEWLLMVDGLDEVMDVDRRRALLDAIGRKVGQYDDEFRFLVTSRPLGETDFAGLRRFVRSHESQRLGEYELVPFDRAALREFSELWFTARRVRDPQRRAAEFVTTVTDSRLGTLLETPLLATIAAYVYEQHPGLDFPLDRTGLYAAFVEHMLHNKRGEIDVGPALRHELGRYGRPGADLADVLVDESEQWLEDLGRDAVFDQTDPSPESIVRWLHRRLREVPVVPGLRRYLEMLLVTTGVIRQAGGTFHFRHQSLAEYFAAGGLARHAFSARSWVDSTRENGLTSLAAFVLARWVQLGHDIAPVLAALTRPGWGHRYRDLTLLGDVLLDGMSLGLPEETIVATVIACVRHRLVLGDQDAAALSDLLTRVAVRTGRADDLLALARDRSISIVKCVEAARVVLRHGSPGLRGDALTAIADAAGRKGEPQEDRLWALNALATLGDAEQSSSALRTIFDVAVRDRWHPRHRALALLSTLDNNGAVLGLLARAVHPQLGHEARTEALDLIAMVLDSMSWRFEGAPTGGDGYTRRYRTVARRGRYGAAATDPNALPGLVLADSESGLTERLAAAFILAWPIEPPFVERLAHTVMRDPRFGWVLRMHVANDIRPWGLHKEAARLMTDLVTDDLVAGVNRVATIDVLFGLAPDVASDHLYELLTDPGADPTIRHLAWSVLHQRDPAAAAAVTEQWNADPAVPFVLRVRTAAVRALAERRSASVQLFERLARSPVAAPSWQRMYIRLFGLCVQHEGTLYRVAARLAGWTDEEHTMRWSLAVGSDVSSEDIPSRQEDPANAHR